MRRKSDKSKLKQGYGTGRLGNYKPYIRVSEFNSPGTCANPIDWKTGRTVHLLSQVEKQFWYMLRFSNQIYDVREHFPLDLEETKKLANKLGIPHPHNDKGYCVMTTDFLVDLKNGEQLALSLDSNITVEQTKSKSKKVEYRYLEKEYWNEKGIDWILVPKDAINKIYAKNIEDVTYYYSYEYVTDDISLVKHLIANKYLMVDMATDLLDYKEITEKLMLNTTINEIEQELHMIEEKEKHYV